MTRNLKIPKHESQTSPIWIAGHLLNLLNLDAEVMSQILFFFQPGKHKTLTAHTRLQRLLRGVTQNKLDEVISSREFIRALYFSQATYHGEEELQEMTDDESEEWDAPELWKCAESPLALLARLLYGGSKSAEAWDNCHVRLEWLTVYDEFLKFMFPITTRRKAPNLDILSKKSSAETFNSLVRKLVVCHPHFHGVMVAHEETKPTDYNKFVKEVLAGGAIPPLGMIEKDQGHLLGGAELVRALMAGVFSSTMVTVPPWVFKIEWLNDQCVWDEIRHFVVDGCSSPQWKHDVLPEMLPIDALEGAGWRRVVPLEERLSFARFRLTLRLIFNCDDPEKATTSRCVLSMLKLFPWMIARTLPLRNVYCIPSEWISQEMIWSALLGQARGTSIKYDGNPVLEYVIWIHTGPRVTGPDRTSALDLAEFLLGQVRLHCRSLAKSKAVYNTLNEIHASCDYTDPVAAPYLTIMELLTNAKYKYL